MERLPHSGAPATTTEVKKPLDSAHVFQDVEIKQSTGLV
jgi:hypothetical protein